jgi:voltage-gated potassium channel
MVESKKNIHELKQKRWDLLEKINRIADKPLIILSFVWLSLLIIDFTRGLNELLKTINYIIWICFILDFFVEIIIAPRKWQYLKRNWLTSASLVLPALRILRVIHIIRFLRVTHTVRAISLLRFITVLNRSMGAVSYVLGRHGIGYLLTVTAIITFASAAAMARFESPDALREAGFVKAAEAGAGLRNYGDALWWTAMVMTTMGSEYWPKTTEGRLLGWLLALYAFAIFGYITATIASYFIGYDMKKKSTGKEDIGADNIRALQGEISALRNQVAFLLTHQENNQRNKNENVVRR